MENIIKLTKNDQKVLGYLSDNARMTDSEIAKKMKLTVSSVSRIREKLVVKGVIRGSYTSIDYNLLGLKCYALVFYSATSKWWDKINDKKVKKIMCAPQIITCIRTNERDLSYIIIYGFANNKICNSYFNEIQRIYNDYLRIEKLIILSSDNFMKNDPTGTLKFLFGKNDVHPNKELFYSMIKEE